MLSSSVQAGLLVALALAVGVLIWSNVSGRTRTATCAAVAAAMLALAPYALAGPQGWRQYAVIIGLTIAIVGLLFLSATAHRLVFARRPRTRLGAGVRFALDALGAVAIMAITFWPTVMASPA
jgi:uncharacterized membrane protein